MTRYFVGVAWPYANGPFHIGHLAGAYLPGDAFARFHRLRGDEVLMVSGSDMHGTPILVRAEKEGTTPEAIARRYDAVNREAFERLGFSFDRFTDTRTLVHERTVQELFLKLLERGYVGRRTEPNAYCPKHARFLPDRYVVGTCPHCGFEQARGDECEHCGRALESGALISPRCSLCGTPAERRSSEHFYLLLDRLAGPLAAFVAEHRNWRPGVAKVAENFLAEGLHPTPITRDLDWGIPIPLEGYEGKRFYVWFDALVGYLSASKEWAIRAGRPEAWAKYWDPKEATRHFYFIGKDNIFHHTILWPGVLLGVGGLPLPYDVPANEWLVLGGRKLAKSGPSGNEATVPALLEHYPPDQIRFYAALPAPQNHDTEFDPAEFEKVYEEILANQLGNLVQRLLVLVRDRLGGRVPSPPDLSAIVGPDGIGAEIRAAHARITEAFEKVELKEALELALSEIRAENRRFHDAKPWAASEEDRARAVFEGLWVIEAASVWLAPFLPFSTTELRRMLGLDGAAGHGEWERVLRPPEGGRPIGPVHPLFPKEDRRVAKAATATPTPAAPAGPVGLDVRVARIVEARAHPSADRLLALRVDAGEGRIRSVVAGLRAYYRPEELLGRRIALLANLAPRTIRSIESEGMVLASEAGESVALLVPPEDVPVGRSALGRPPEGRPITIDEFASVELRVGRVESSAGGDGVRISLGDRWVTADGDWPKEALVVVRAGSPSAERASVVAFGPGLALGAGPGTLPGAKVR